jgi:hypothetical protein
MIQSAETRLDGTTLVVSIPMRFQRRGGRKRIVAPDGGEIAPTTKPQPDGTLLKALARAWRWQRLLDEGVYASVSEIGETENISKSYVSRILRLALLAPDLVASVLAGQTDQTLMLKHLERPLPASWMEQRQRSLGALTPLRTERHRHLACMPVLRAGAAEQGIQRRPPLVTVFYFLLSVVAAPGFGLASALDTVPVDARSFFLLALGFLASRLLLF